jgi:hypothetical protein
VVQGSIKEILAKVGRSSNWGRKPMRLQGGNRLAGSVILALSALPAALGAAQVSVAVVPTSATLAIGQTRQFTATVRNSSNTGVGWQVNGVTGGNSTVGTISLTGLYAAPAAVPRPATVTVTAVANADATKSASAIAFLTRPQVTVSISPASVSVQPGGSQQFAAAVVNTTKTAVIWEVNGVIGGSPTTGTITPSGVYTAPTAIPSPAIVIVTAVSRQTPAAAANANITIGTGTAFYVATTGNDNNNGSLGLPWRTIQHAADTAVAGDTVYAMGGVYNETVTFPKSGSASAGYITFESYPGQTAILDGTGLSIPGGQHGLFTILNQSYLAISGFEIRNYTSNSVSQVPIGIYITGADSYLQILGNRIHDIVTTAKGCNANALGMAVYGSRAPASINNLTISGNEIYNLTTGCSESLSLDGNVMTWTITNNLIHDNNNIGIDAIGFEGVSPDPAYDQARNGEISGNIVYNITSYDNPAYGRQYAADGIYVDGGTQITIERNLVHNVDLAIEMASEHSGHVTSYITARSNLVYSANAAGISIGGYAASVGGTDHCSVVNNTLFQNDTKSTGSGEFQIQFYATNNIFENNVVNATTQGLFVHNFTNSSPSPATVDYNVYFSSTGAAAGIWDWNGTKYTGFASYQSATGQDAHSSFANPLFVSTSIPELQVQPPSPAVNAGINLGAAVVGTLDFAGNPRVQGGNIDIGAYEQP